MKVLFACGGTGGDIFPAIALAEGFEEKLKNCEIVFVGTPRGLEKTILSKTNWRLEMIEVPSLADKTSLGKIAAGFGLIGSLKRAHRLLKKERPDLVISVGMYASGPVAMISSLMKCPTVTLEPNASPGLTNRLLKPFVDRVFVAYPGLEKYFGRKTCRLGIPIRKSILQSPERRTQNAERRTIFIFGGSQGAKKINECMLASLAYLQDLKGKIHFIHQVGRKASAGAFEQVYREKGFSAEVYPFIQDMGTFYRQADFVVSRAGASTVAELVAFKKPSLLIPYPFAARGHQELNARSLEKAGGAKMLLDREMNGERLASAIKSFIGFPNVLKKMEEGLDKLGGNQAADKIVEECLKLVR